MQLPISEFKSLLLKSLTVRGLTFQEAETVAQPFFEAELAGKKTHGISKFFLLDDAINKREGKPEIIKDTFNYSLINAHKELGYISAQFAVDILIQKAREYGNSIVAVTNSYYYSMLGIYARRVAEAGLVGIITNNGGPAAVAPFGGVDPIFGTNPIAIGIPYKGNAIVFDMATSERTWGEINLAKVEKRKLEQNIFFDKQGVLTTDPYQADSIKPFGGAKGYGLNFMLEILTGAFVGAKMGLQSKDGYDLGFLFQAFSPDMFTTQSDFDRSIEQLIKEIKSSRKDVGYSEIYLPGEQSQKRIEDALKKGVIEVSSETLDVFKRFSEGENVKDLIKLVE